MNPIADAISGGVKGLGDLALSFVKEFHVSPERAAEMELAIQKQQDSVLQSLIEVDKAQLEVNKEEAKSSSLWIAGWRPYIGWGCGTSFLYSTLIEPLMRWVAVVIFHYPGQFPVLDSNITMQVLFALLGMGGLRSWEKYKGVARETHK